MDKIEANYYELTITIKEHIELVSDFITDKTDDAIEIGDDYIVVRSTGDIEHIIRDIKTYITSLEEYFKQDIEYDIKIETKKNIDWIEKFQKSVEPIVIDRFYVRASWHKKHDDLIDVMLDPSFAFGTGHHFTTNSCILAISNYIKKDDLLLDVGCGSGVLSISASKLGAVVDICDTDPLALQNSISNFKANNCNINEHWIGSIKDSSKSYNVILANIVSDIIITISKDLVSKLKPDGILIVSGILKKYEDRVLKRFTEIKLIEKKEDDHWVTLIFRKIDE
jgi:ribosomal protein L11 methyltransferase